MTTERDAPAFSRWLPPGLALAFITAIFAVTIARRGAVIPTDLEFYRQWLPYRLFLKAAWEQSRFPLWCPDLLAGFPFAAFPHTGSFYPLNLLFAALDYPLASTIFHFIHLTIIVTFIHLLCRRQGASPASSALATLSFALIAPVFHQMAAPHDFTSLTWICGLALFLTRLAGGGKFIDFAGTAACAALALLAGNLEMVLMAGAALLGFILLTARPDAGRALTLLAALALGALLASPQVFCTWGLLPHSYRYGHPVKIGWDVTGDTLSMLQSTLVFLQSTVILASPDLKTYFPFYLGFAFFGGILAPPATDEQGRARKVLLLIAAAAYLYWSNFFLLRGLFDAIPILGRYGSPDVRYRAMHAVLILGAAASARGLDGLAAKAAGVRPRLFHVFAAVFLIEQTVWTAAALAQAVEGWLIIASRALTAAMAGLALFYTAKARAGSGIVKAVFAAILLFDLGVVALVGRSVAPIDEIKPPAGIELIKTQPGERAHLISFINQDNSLWRLVRPGEDRGFLTGFVRNGVRRTHEVLIAMAGGDFNLFDYRTVSPANKPLLDFLGVKYLVARRVPVWSRDPLDLDSPILPSRYLQDGVYVSQVPEKADGGRLLPPGSRWEITASLIAGDTLLLQTQPPLDDAFEVMLKEGNTLVHLPRPASAITDTAAFSIGRPAGEGDVLALAVKADAERTFLVRSVRVVNTRRSFEPVARLENVEVLRNRHSLPLFGIYYQAAETPADRELDSLFSPETFDPARVLLLSPSQIDPSVVLPPKDQPRRGHAEIRRYDFDRVELAAINPAPAYLSAAQTFYHGWRAWVDGEEVRVRRADYAFQAVPLPRAGEHRVTMVFEPPEFSTGLFAALSGWLCLAAVCLFRVRRTRV